MENIVESEGFSYLTMKKRKSANTVILSILRLKNFSHEWEGNVNSRALFREDGVKATLRSSFFPPVVAVKKAAGEEERGGLEIIVQVPD